LISVRVALFDEYGIPLYKSDSVQALLAAELVCTTALRHLIFIFSHFVERINEIVHVDRGMMTCLDFLMHSLLRRLQLYLRPIERRIRTLWKEYKMDLDQMEAYLIDSKFGSLWTLLERVGDTLSISESILTKDKVTKKLEDPELGSSSQEASDIPHHDSVGSELVFSSKDQIQGFCINPLNMNQMALVSHKAVREINIDSSVAYFHVCMLT
jgi:hypothetical protein